MSVNCSRDSVRSKPRVDLDPCLVKLQGSLAVTGSEHGSLRAGGGITIPPIATCWVGSLAGVPVQADPEHP